MSVSNFSISALTPLFPNLRNNRLEPSPVGEMGPSGIPVVPRDAVHVVAALGNRPTTETSPTTVTVVRQANGRSAAAEFSVKVNAFLNKTGINTLYGKIHAVVSCLLTPIKLVLGGSLTILAGSLIILPSELIKVLRNQPVTSAEDLQRMLLETFQISDRLVNGLAHIPTLPIFVTVAVAISIVAITRFLIVNPCVYAGNQVGKLVAMPLNAIKNGVLGIGNIMGTAYSNFYEAANNGAIAREELRQLQAKYAEIQRRLAAFEQRKENDEFMDQLVAGASKGRDEKAELDEDISWLLRMARVFLGDPS